MSRSTTANPEAAAELESDFRSAADAELELVSPADPVDITTLAPANLPAIFDGYRATMEGLREQALALVVTDASQKDKMEEAKKLCKQFADTRIQAEKKRVEEVSPLKKITSRIDATVKAIRDGCEVIEEHLKKQYQFVQIQEAQARVALIGEREEQLATYGVDAVAAAMYNLAEMTDEQFEDLLTEKHRAQKYLQQRQKEEEEARQSEEKRQREERAAQAEENARLKREAAEKDRQLKEEREARERAEKLLEQPAPRPAAPTEMSDREKLLRYAAEIRSIPLPELSLAYRYIAEKLLSNVINFIAWIEKKAEGI